MSNKPSSHKPFTTAVPMTIVTSALALLQQAACVGGGASSDDSSVEAVRHRGRDTGTEDTGPAGDGGGACASITMGEANVLSVPDNGNANLLLAQATSLAQAGTIVSLSFYVTGPAGKLRLGLYDASGPSGGPGAKIAETGEIAPALGWNTAPVIDRASLPAGDYWLAYLPSDDNLGFPKAGGAGTFAYFSYAYGAMPATFSAAPTYGSDHWSLYATIVPTTCADAGAGDAGRDAASDAGSDSGSDPLHTYYISKSLGSDAHTATEAHSKSTPWAHLPGMAGCTSGAACTFSPGPGDRFVLYGGDTWSAADLGVDWNGSGTSAAPIYVGVDTAWYDPSVCGASFCRPIWSCQGKTCGGGFNHNFWTNCQNHVTLDNIEMTGLFQSTSGGLNFIDICGQYQTYENLYLHGWSHAAGAASDDSAAFGAGGYDITGLSIHDNVIDGADTSRDMLVCFIGDMPLVYDNVCRYVTNGFEASGNSWHDNLVEYIEPCFDPNGCHQNFMFHFHPSSGSAAYLYNNVLRHATWQYSGGAPKLWLEGLGSCSGCTTYAYNNVIYDQQAGNYLNIADHPAADYGTFYLFNNTFEVGSDGSVGGWSGNSPGPEGQIYTVHLANNHWIATGVDCTSGCTETSDLLQSVAQANAQGYNDTSEPFAFSPTAATNATVGSGANLGSYCSGEVAALCSDTTFAVGYDAVHHRVIAPARTTNARPTTGAWDIGAYRFPR